MRRAIAITGWVTAAAFYCAAAGSALMGEWEMAAVFFTLGCAQVAINA